jgi:hypothetical protein
LRTLETEEVRELGAEWASLQALRELGMDTFLHSRDWSEENVQLAMSHLQDKIILYMDAGISTKENLMLLQEKGYDYVCVSRSKGIERECDAESIL